MVILFSLGDLICVCIAHENSALAGRDYDMNLEVSQVLDIAESINSAGHEATLHHCAMKFFHQYWAMV